MTKKIRTLYFTFTICASLFTCTGIAQIWVPVTHASGSRVINGRTVTVTSEGSVRTEGTFRHCGANPYTIGINYNGIPGSYTFAFSPATTTVRFLMSATNIGEVNSFYINGAHYPLTPANLQPLPACDTQFQLPLSIQAGNVVFPGPTIPGQSWYGQFGSGIVEINYPTGIDSIRVHSNGIMGGTTFGFAYWGFYAEASNDYSCKGDSLHLYGGPDEPGVSYLWTGPNGFSSTVMSPVIPNSDIQHEGIYTLRTVFTVDTAYDTTLVILRDVPAKPVVTADTLICYGGTARFNASSATAGVNYLWGGPNNYRSTNANTSVRNARERDTGTYTVVAILNGCPSPPAIVPFRVVFPVDGDTIPVEICRGGTYNFYNQQLTDVGIYAHTLPGTASNGCDSITYISLSYTTPPQDTVSASICQGSNYDFNGASVTYPGFYTDTIKTNEGCDSVVVLHLTVNPATRDTLTVSMCQGETYSFAGKSLTESGEYIDSVKTEAGCDSVLVLRLTVHPLPVVTAAYDSERTPCLGDTILLQAAGAVSYTWYRNGTQIGTNAAFPYLLTYQQNDISLKGADNNECIDSVFLDIPAISCCGIFIPNAFTPNGDGRNDQFRLIPESRISQYQMDIVNRWGRLVFTSADINKSWDGMIDGHPADIGTYFYQIKGKCISGTEIYEKGDLTLIR